MQKWMKHSPVFLCLSVMMLTQPGFTQTSPSDSQTLKEILNELRAMHNDVRLSQTTSILLAELQLQQATVSSALSRRDNLREQVSKIQLDELSKSEELEGFGKVSDPVRQKEAESTVWDLKRELIELKRKREAIATTLEDAELRLRKEQTTLDGIQAQLNETIKKLQPAPGQ